MLFLIVHVPERLHALATDDFEWGELCHFLAFLFPDNQQPVV